MNAPLPAEPVTPAKLRNIADWLMNGCNRGQAAVELRILAQDLERAHETNGDGHDLHCRATARRTDIGCDCGGFDRRRFEAAPCYLCGYSGEGYYQVSFHPCAALYHERTAPETTTPREAVFEDMETAAHAFFNTGQHKVAGTSDVQSVHQFAKWLDEGAPGYLRRAVKAGAPNNFPNEGESSG
jgi:hypothetical protein